MQGSSSSSCVKPSPVTMPAIAGADDDVPQARRIVVAHRLPLLASPDPNSPFGFAFSLDADAIPLQLSRGFTSPVTYIGTLPASAESEVVPSDELDAYLMATFSCLPVHIAGDRHTQFYHGFCKHQLWPLLHYMQPSFIHDSYYRAFIAANRMFADRVMEVISPDAGDLIVIHDYHLMVLPTFLRHRCPHAGVGLFLHSPFPPEEIFRSAGFRDELLRGLLNADLVGFHTIGYARNFISCCSSILGVSLASVHGGHLGFNYHGRAVIVKIFSVGIDLGQLRRTLASPETAAKAREIAEEYRGRVLMVGVDDLDLFKGVKLKLLALEKLFQDNQEFRGKVVLVQINNAARSHGPDVDAVRDEMEKIVSRIKRRFVVGEEEGSPEILVRIIDGPVPMHEKVAYYAMADCCVVTSVRDGLNRIPYFYTVCREEFPGGERWRRRNASAVVLSEFAGSSASLRGAIRVNPWSSDTLAQSMADAITMAADQKLSRHRKNYRYLCAHDVATWAPEFDATLRLACKDHPALTFVGMGLGMRFRAVAVRPEFKAIAAEDVVPAYQAAASRLIVLDYDGTLVPQLPEEREMAPGVEVVRVLNDLCDDTKNVVFVVSGRGKDQLAAWFAPCEKLGICAEHGYFTRWSRDDPWEVSNREVVLGSGWEAVALEAMRQYTEATDGSHIERKETGMAWHYQNADPVLGPRQARELHEHLVDILANEPAAVAMDSNIVEVNPESVNKGVAVERLLAAMARRGRSPDFVACAGDGEADEAMFAAVERAGGEAVLPAGARVFLCTVGRKPSKAAFYVDEPEDVVDLLRGLLAIISE